MFRLIGNIIKLVTMISTLLVAIEQIREIMDKRKAKRAPDIEVTNVA